jgi:hypothetical protein
MHVIVDVLVDGGRFMNPCYLLGLPEAFFRRLCV